MKKLIVSNLSFAFDKKSTPFFQHVNVTFESGRLSFIQGKNGVGKSTFFSILQGTTNHNAALEGSISFDNNQFTIKNNSLVPQFTAHVKTVIQDINKMIVTALTVKENLQLAQLPVYPQLTPLSYHITVPSLMHDFGVDTIMPVYKLSGGQKQILAIMMVLQKPAQILLLDEPTAALDEKNTHMVMQFLVALAQQRDLIVIIITHDKELITTYASHATVVISAEEEHGTRAIKQQ